MARNKKRGRGGHGRHKSDVYRTDIVNKSDMNNERFSAYYRAQNIVPEEEWDYFLQGLRQPLPTTFRVAGSRQIAKSLNQTIKDVYVPSLSGVSFEGEPMMPPVQIPWYPEGLAWHFNVPKRALRKSPELKKFHSFLVFETDVGNISRQEAVSMIPPLFLDVEPHHKVMDMCAAPGSKTAQLLEALHVNDSVTATSIPTGLLIANDNDQKRTHMLIHQSSRLPSPALMVTNLDASNYPIIRVPASHQQLGKRSKRTEQLLFDRILCDVPCSGDGTLRKNIGIWKSWQVMDGNGLHSLQLRILQRAMKMLTDDGRIVYSTCSLNPVENEAVVASALMSNPDFELIDVSMRYPELKRNPGLTSWRPTADRSVKTTYPTYKEFLESLTEAEANATKMTEGHWPPASAEELNLTRCMRIYPHLQDTGGFFVAVLQKQLSRRRHLSLDSHQNGTGERKREAEEPSETPETKKPRLVDDTVSTSLEVDPAVDSSEAIPQQEMEDLIETSRSASEEVHPNADYQGGEFKEHPFTFLKPDDPILRACIERLHLTSDFPSSNVLVRNPEGDAVRSLYLANDVVKSVVNYNDYARIRLTAAGTKIFIKQEAGKGLEAQFRILGEGSPVVLPYIDPAAIMDADVNSLKIMLHEYHPACASFDEPFKSIIEAKGSGNHIIKILAGVHGGVTLVHDLHYPIWKSNVSVSLMIDKKAKSALSLRLFGDDITVAGREAKQKKKTMAGNTPADLAGDADAAVHASDDDAVAENMEVPES